MCFIPLLFLSRKQSNHQSISSPTNPLPVILPYYKISLFWDFIYIFFIFVNVFKIPFELAYSDGDMISQEVTDASRLIFAINFLVQINTAYYENGVLQKERGKIWIHFIQKYLLIDVLTYLCLWINPFGIPLLRMVFLVKYFSYYEIIEKLAESLQLSGKYDFLINLMTLLIEILILCHLFACSWFMVGDYQERAGVEPNWVNAYGLVQRSMVSQYIYSIYFAIVTIGTIGFGDVTPKNDLERAFISAMALFSSCVFGYIITNIQIVYNEYNSKQEAFLKNQSELNNYMFSREVNPHLQQMARKYLKYVHQQNYQKGVMPSQTLNVLSKFLREEILEEIFKRSIKNMRFMRQFSQQFQNALSIKMKEHTYGPDEMIMKSGSFSPPSLYYVLKGKVEISLDQGNKKSIYYSSIYENKPFFEHKHGDVFGIYEFVSQNYQSQQNAKSLEITTIHQISLADFIEVINQFSLDKEKYLELKDNLNLYQLNSIAKVFCHSCKSSQHLLKDCPIFFYKPSKQKVITHFNHLCELEKKEVQRSTKRKLFNSLYSQYEIEDDCAFYRERNYSELGSLMKINEEQEEEDQKDQQTDKKPTTATDYFMSKDTENNENQSNIQFSLNLSKPGCTNNSPQLMHHFDHKITEEKEEDSKGEMKKSENLRSSMQHSLISLKVPTKEIQQIEEKRSARSLTPSCSSSSSSSSTSPKSSSLSITKKSSMINQSSNKGKPKEQGSLKSIIEIDNSCISNSRQSIGRSGQSKKGNLLSARSARKNVTIDDSKFKNEPDAQSTITVQLPQLSPRISGVTVQSQIQPQTQNITLPQLQPSRLSQNLIGDPTKSSNNIQSKGYVKRQITIGQMQLVLEQMQMQNAQKVAKQLIEQNEDVITETIRTFKIYMIHNNVGNVIKEYHKYRLKERAKKKRIFLKDQKVNSNESQSATKIFLSRPPLFTIK